MKINTLVFHICLFVFITCKTENVDLELLRNAESLFMENEETVEERLKDLSKEAINHYYKICSDQKTLSIFCFNVYKLHQNLLQAPNPLHFTGKQALRKENAEYVIDISQNGSFEVQILIINDFFI